MAALLIAQPIDRERDLSALRHLPIPVVSVDGFERPQPLAAEAEAVQVDGDRWRGLLLKGPAGSGQQSVDLVGETIARAWQARAVGVHDPKRDGVLHHAGGHIGRERAARWT